MCYVMGVGSKKNWINLTKGLTLGMPTNRLSDGVVKAIYFNKKQIKTKDLASQYGTNVSTIRDIQCKRTYKNITKELK